MLYPLPVVMVSLADRDDRSNIITLAWVGNRMYQSAHGVDLRTPREIFYPILKETGEFAVINLTTKEAGICHRLLWREKRTGRG